MLNMQVIYIKKRKNTHLTAEVSVQGTNLIFFKTGLKILSLIRFRGAARWILLPVVSQSQVSCFQCLC